jgi:hypothetical protein
MGMAAVPSVRPLARAPRVLASPANNPDRDRFPTASGLPGVPADRSRGHRGRGPWPDDGHGIRRRFLQVVPMTDVCLPPWASASPPRGNATDDDDYQYVLRSR